MKAIIAIICFFLWVDVSFAYTPDSITFRLNLKKGDKYSFTSSGTYKKLIIVEDTIAMSSSETFTSDYLMSVVDVRNDGTTMISMKLENYHFSSQKTYFDIRDSTKNLGREDVKDDSNKNLIGVTFMLILNERSEVLSSSFDSVLAAGDGKDKVFPQISKEILDLVVFPEHSIKVGE